MAKKIIIVYSGARHQGGVERYLENLFRFYDKKKMSLVLVSLGEWPLCEKVRELHGEVKVMPRARIRPQTLFDIAKVIKEQGADLAVSQGVVANFYARLAAKVAKVSHLTAVHSDMSPDYPNPFIRFLYILSDRCLRGTTSRYIAVSEFLKDELVKSRVPKDKVSVIYNGVEIKEARCKRQETRYKIQDTRSKIQETKKKRGEIVVGSIGRLHKVKGYENLIRAFSYMNSNGLKLVIWGDGKERKSLEKLVEGLGLGEKVELAGHTNDAEEALANTDIYIQPSLSEGFGLTVVEAMLTGKPVVVTPVGSLKEIVTDGKTGIMAKGTSPKDLTDALEKILSDEDLLKSLGQKAAKEAKEKFSTEKWIRETERVYMETAK